VNRISKSRSTDFTGDGDPGDEGSTGSTSWPRIALPMITGNIWA
jgi:hypothetical protein